MCMCAHGVVLLHVCLGISFFAPWSQCDSIFLKSTLPFCDCLIVFHEFWCLIKGNQVHKLTRTFINFLCLFSWNSHCSYHDIQSCHLVDFDDWVTASPVLGKCSASCWFLSTVTYFLPFEILSAPSDLEYHFQECHFWWKGWVGDQVWTMMQWQLVDSIAHFSHSSAESFMSLR